MITIKISHPDYILPVSVRLLVTLQRTPALSPRLSISDYRLLLRSSSKSPPEHKGAGGVSHLSQAAPSGIQRAAAGSPRETRSRETPTTGRAHVQIGAAGHAPAPARGIQRAGRRPAQPLRRRAPDPSPPRAAPQPLGGPSEGGECRGPRSRHPLHPLASSACQPRPSAGR